MRSVVRVYPGPPLSGIDRASPPDGAIAQLGERLLCKQEVVGSIPSGSTNFLGALPRSALEAKQHCSCQEPSFARSRPCRRATIFYIVKRGSTWGFSSRKDTQVCLSENAADPGQWS